MGFQNKRIMFVCQEGYSYPFYFLSEKWKKNNKLAAFFYNPAESKYNECYYNRNTYYAIKKLDYVKLYDLNDMADEYTKLIDKNMIADEKYLQKIEKEYTHFFGVNEQIIASQKSSMPYHWRRHYKNSSYVQQINWLILCYKGIEKMISDFQPEIILDNEQAEMGRTILREISYRQGIPYICLEHARFDSYQIPNFTLGIKLDQYFVDFYNKCLTLTDTDLAKEIDIVKQWRKQNKIMTVENKRFFKKESFFNMAKETFGYFCYYFNEDFVAKNRKLKKSNPYLYPGSGAVISYFIAKKYWNKRLSKPNRFFSVPFPGIDYVYMPLHLIPESTTFTKAPLYVNELSIIEAVSKTLPAGWWLYVKEHHAMAGERGREFYERVNQLPNAKMVQYDYYTDPKPWILNSKGVITISGTSAYEAAMLNKPSIVFGDVPFQVIEGVNRLHSFEELRDAFRKFELVYDNIHSCAAYIKAVVETGDNVDMEYIFQQGERIMYGMDMLDEEYEKQLLRFENVFQKGYKIYESRYGNEC